MEREFRESEHGAEQVQTYSVRFRLFPFSVSDVTEHESDDPRRGAA